MRFYKKKLKGFSLSELVLAIGIFSMISSSLTLLVVDSTRSSQNTRVRAEASHFIQEIGNALVSIKSDSWYNLAQYTETGPKHLNFENNKYSIMEGSGEYKNFIYEFSVGHASRDDNFNLVSSGGTIDPHSRLISISIIWIDALGKSHTLDPQIYINDWNSNSIVYTAESDFSIGTHSGTIVSNLQGGEIHLEELFYPDWCNPELSITSYDLP
jgi:type II secretory pathway pseudopilin PulG